jgi:hypothetical protein
LVQKKEIGLVAGDELFDFGLTFEDIKRQIDEREEGGSDSAITRSYSRAQNH